MFNIEVPPLHIQVFYSSLSSFTIKSIYISRIKAQALFKNRKHFTRIREG